MGTLLSFGSMVQKGKFSAAAWLFVSTLKKVDFLKIKTAVRPIRLKVLVSRAWWFDSVIRKHFSKLCKTPFFSFFFSVWGCGGYSNRLNIWALKSKKYCAQFTRSDNPIMDQLYMEARAQIAFSDGSKSAKRCPMLWSVRFIFYGTSRSSVLQNRQTIASV